MQIFVALFYLTNAILDETVATESCPENQHH